MVVCAAVGCSNKPEKKIPGVTYHRFPVNLHMRQQWTLAVRRADWGPTKNSILCSRHFENEMFDWEKSAERGRKFLKSTAVPTIFDKNKFAVQQDFLPLQTYTIPQLLLPVKEEPLDEILNDSNITALLNECNGNHNGLLVVPDRINTNETIRNHNQVSQNNVVVVSNCIYTQNVLNSEGVNDNRILLVSDGTNVKTEWPAYNEEEQSGAHCNSKTNKFGLQKYNHDPLILHSDDFILGRVRDLEEVVNDYKKRVKVLGQTSRRQNAKLDSLRRELYKLNRKHQSKVRCTSSPVVHLLEQKL